MGADFSEDLAPLRGRLLSSTASLRPPVLICDPLPMRTVSSAAADEEPLGQVGSNNGATSAAEWSRLTPDEPVIESRYQIKITSKFNYL